MDEHSNRQVWGLLPLHFLFINNNNAFSRNVLYVLSFSKCPIIILAPSYIFVKVCWEPCILDVASYRTLLHLVIGSVWASHYIGHGSIGLSVKGFDLDSILLKGC